MKRSCVTSFGSVYLQEKKNGGAVFWGSEIQKKKHTGKMLGKNMVLFTMLYHLLQR